MFTSDQIQSLKAEFDKAKSFVIALPPEAEEDLIASGLSLFLTLKQADKLVNIGCSSPIKVSSSKLFGVDQIKSTIGSQNLIVTLDYPEVKLEKIDYQTNASGQIELHVKPRAGEPAPSGDNIHLSYAGAAADLIFVLGISSLEELGKLYSDEKDFFDHTPIISLNQSPTPNSFARLSFHDPKVTTTAETVCHLLSQLNLTPTADAATNLLQTITAATQNYTSPKTSADTFEITAQLLRAGATRTLSPPPGFPAPFGLNDSSPIPTSPALFNQPIPQQWRRPQALTPSPVPSAGSK